jgi:hypothetical protein
MTLYYSNLNNIDEDICANIYIQIIDKLKTIFNIIPYNKIMGPPSEFSYFNKVIDYIFNIIKLFEADPKFYQNIINYSSYKNNNYIISTLESIISDKFHLLDNRSFILKCCALSDIIEELYTICHFFQFKINHSNIYPTFNIKNYYKEIILNNNNKLFIQINCVSNIDFLNFILDNGYSTTKYWSNNGLKWLNNYPKNIPYFWKFSNNIWYLKQFDKYIKISDIPYLPIQNISYHEVEAYCNYKNVKLPKLKHYQIISSEQYYDQFYFCNVWEWMSTNNKNQAQCFGGSLYNKLLIKNINDIKIFNKSAQHYFTGFRTIKI